MRLRSALSGVCAVVLLAGAAPAVAAGDTVEITLVVTVDGASQSWTAEAELGTGPELVAAAGACDAGGVVDIDPTGRTIAVTVGRTVAPADVSLTVKTDAIGGLEVVTPALAGVTLTATPEIAILTWRVAAATDAECAVDTAIFRYVAPGQALAPVDQPLAGVTAGAPAPAAPPEAATPDATPAAAVVAVPRFTG